MSKALIQLMEEHLKQVWSERNPASRLKALDALYAKDAILYEVGEVFNGHEEINNKVSTLVNSIPPDFVFTRLKPVIINNNAGRLLWGLGPTGKAPVATGTDIAIFENGKIKLAYVFLDE